MVAPVPMDSSSGCACTNMMRRAGRSLTRATLRRANQRVRMTTRPRAGDHSGVDYPELAARTRRFTCGAPRAVTVSADGARVIFVRSAGPEDPADQLWVFVVPSGQERLIADPASLPAAASRAADGDLPAEERALRDRKSVV